MSEIIAYKEQEICPSDRISQLPDEILDKILHLLDVSEAVRTSVLSKTWRYLWTLRESVSSLIITLDCGHIDQGTKEPLPEKEVRELRESFIQHIHDPLQTLIQKKLYVPNFCIGVFFYHPTLISHIDRCLELAIKTGVQVLEVEVRKPWRTENKIPYSLPRDVLLTNSLIEVTINGCKLEAPANSKLSHLSHLRKLHLDNVDMYDHWLITGCPLLEDLKLKCCSGMKDCHIFGLPNLRRVELKLCRGLEKVHIEAASVRTFVYQAKHKSCLYHYVDETESEIIIDDCDKLQNLELKTSCLTDELFQALFSKCSNLEDLSLNCHMLRNIKVGSPQLKRLALKDNCLNLEKVEMDTPNLVSFVCKGRRRIPLSCTDHPSLPLAILFQEPSEESSKPKLSFNLDTLRCLVPNLNNLENLTVVVRSNENILIYEDIRQIFLPNVITGLEIATITEFSVYNLIIQVPCAISVIASSSDKIVKILDESLAKRRKERRDLKVEFINDCEGLETYDWFAWLNSIPLPNQRVGFLCEWKHQPFAYHKIMFPQ